MENIPRITVEHLTKVSELLHKAKVALDQCDLSECRKWSDAVYEVESEIDTKLENNEFGSIHKILDECPKNLAKITLSCKDQ